MTTPTPREAASWMLRDLRRALAAGWAPEWVKRSGWPEAEAVARGWWLPARQGYSVVPETARTISRAVDQRIAQVGARAPAWLAPEQRAGKGKQGTTPPSPSGEGGAGQNASPGSGAGATSNPGGGAPKEERDASLTSAPPAGGSVQPDGTAQAAPPVENDPASREGGEAPTSGHSEAERAPRAGERTARSGEAGGGGQDSVLPASQKARGGTEADHRGATPTASAHDQEQETPGTAGSATGPGHESETRHNLAPGVAVLRLLQGGLTAAQPANDAAEASGSLSPDEVAHDVTFSGGGPSRLVAVHHHGGVTATWAGLDRTGRELREARLLGQALERWLQHLDLGGVGDPTPRIDGRKLVRELVTRRCTVSRAHRWERQPGVILVTVDVSGSCSVAAPGTLAAARGFAEAHPDRVAVIVHSNGFVEERCGVAARWPEPPDLGHVQRNEVALAPWILRHAGPTLAGALALGDWDAGDLYQALAQLAPLVWLDSYAATHGAKPASRNLRQGWTAAKQPVVWMQGVQTAAAAAAAVQAARRQQ